MPKRGQHPFDSVADQTLEWIQETTDYAVEALRGGYRTPFSANITEAQKLDYYRRKLFTQNPDGSIDFSKPNLAERDKLLKKLGTKNYAEVMTTILPQNGQSRPLPDDDDEDYDEEEEDSTYTGGYS
jgi:hypothetical protein